MTEALSATSALPAQSGNARGLAGPSCRFASLFVDRKPEGDPGGTRLCAVTDQRVEGCKAQAARASDPSDISSNSRSEIGSSAVLASPEMPNLGGDPDQHVYLGGPGSVRWVGTEPGARRPALPWQRFAGI